MEEFNRLFRKAAFGGFNKEDVINYIEKTKNDFFEYKQQSEKTIRELRDRIELFEKNSPDVSAEASFVREGFGENFSENGESSPISTTVVEINSATDHLKQTADLICESLTQFMDHISSSCISVAVEAAQLPSADADAAERETRDAFKEEETEKKEEHTGEKPFEQIIDSIFSDTEKIETNAKEEKNDRADFLSDASFIV